MASIGENNFKAAQLANYTNSTVKLMYAWLIL